MSAELDFKFFGWNNTPGHDKIWGWFIVGEKVYNFWGPRGAAKLVKIRFKEWNEYSNFTHNKSDAQDKEREKRRKGYDPVALTVEDDVLVEVEKVYPGFTAHVKKMMFIAKLSGTIKGTS